MIIKNDFSIGEGKKMDDSIYREIIQNMPVGYALHRIILDDSGVPCDYMYIETNEAFELFTGLVSLNIIGKKVSEVASGRDYEKYSMISAFGQVALTDEKMDLEQYSEKFGKWYRIHAFSPEKKYFITLLHDITKEKADLMNTIEKEEKLQKEVNRHRILTDSLMQGFDSQQEQLDDALNKALLLTESEYGYIYLYDENTREFNLNSWTNGVMDACGIADRQTRYHLEKTGLWGEVVRQRKPIIRNDFQRPDPLKKGCPQGHVALAKFMSIPVIINEKIVAVVGLANKKTDYDDNDVYEMTMFMQGIWAAVQQKVEHKKVEHLLAQTRSMFNEHESSMMLIDPQTGAILDANPSASGFYGYSKEELLGLSIQDINIQTNEEIAQLRNKALARTQKYFTLKHRIKSGEIKNVDVYSSPISYKGQTALYSIIFDVTEREAAFERLKYLGIHDHLTNLYNRSFWDEQLVQLDVPENWPLGIVMADVNGLKLINDSFGHSEGDRLLQKASAILLRCKRETDIIARTGGDEFCALLPNSDDRDVKAFISSIKALSRKDLTEAGILSISFGYAIKYDEHSNISEILSDAENDMYKQKMYETSSMRNKTIRIILNTLFEKSKREMEHSARVGDIAAAIAAAMGFDAEKTSKIKAAGLLHDIGKIGIDEKILNKPGKLEPDEWEEIKKHPESGWRILSNADEFSELADYTLHHHERWDGKGYPLGEKGDKIPIESRIISLADSYDAMTKDRTYRKGMNREEAVEEIIRCSGTQFDPAVVMVFVEKVVPTQAVL